MTTNTEAMPEPDRAAFERHWLNTRRAKKSAHELQRHALQPQTYVADNANRHWVTWQAATAHAAKLCAARDAEIERLRDLLKEARKIVRASSSRSLAKDWDERTTAALKESKS